MFEDQVFPVEKRDLKQINRDNAQRHGTHVTPRSSHDATQGERVVICPKCEGRSTPGNKSSCSLCGGDGDVSESVAARYKANESD